MASEALSSSALTFLLAVCTLPSAVPDSLLRDLAIRGAIAGLFRLGLLGGVPEPFMESRLLSDLGQGMGGRGRSAPDKVTVGRLPSLGCRLNFSPSLPLKDLGCGTGGAVWCVL